jgi:tetratricopeptide (TPR) repeat protein
MNLRPKTKRRLGILLAGTLVVAGSGTALVTIQLHRLEARRQEYRALAMTAFDHGDYTSALHEFKKYLNDSGNSTDADAIYAYAVSRSHVPRPDLSHLVEAKANFNRYLELRPGDDKAQHQLLNIYRQLGYQAEVLSLSDTLLAKDPDDDAALSAKVQALTAESKFDQALELSKKLNDLSPTDLPRQMRTFDLMARLKQPAETIIARSEALRQAHPNDPRFELLRAAAAAAYGQDLAGAKAWLLTAAGRTPPDADFTRLLCGAFDRMGMYDQARAQLEKSATGNKSDPELTVALVQREWEAGQYDQVLSRLQPITPADPKSDARLLAFKALALYGQSERPTTQPTPPNRAQADAIVAALAQRHADSEASAWVSLLHARFSIPRIDAKEAIKLCQTALPTDPDNAVARYFTGWFYRELGETELALQSWRQAGVLSPPWAMPHLLMAQTLLDRGQVEQAAIEARAAAQRARRSLDVRVTLALIDYAGLGPQASQEEIDRLLNEVRLIQTESPNEPRTLPLYTALLARAGRKTDAAAAINKALDAQPALPADALLKLARISAAEHLGVESAVTDHLNDLKSTTPESALDQAALLASLGKSQAGLRFLTAARDAAKDDSPAWQLAVARYREAIQDPGVAETWASLADANPNELDIQRAVLNAASTWTNRGLIDRTINRLKTLTGDEGIEWRLDRARWQLAAPDDLKNNASAAAAAMAEVVRIAPALPQPLVIWAQALEKLGDPASAIDRLRTASNLAPGDLDIALSLARLLQSQGKTDDARNTLDRIARNPALNLAGRLQVARLLARQGQYEPAIDVLQPADDSNADRNLLLARCYQGTGKFDDAAKLYDHLLKQSAPGENTLRAAAWFYAQRGNLARGRQILSRLNDLKLPAGTRELAQAEFAEIFDQPNIALAQYQAATTAAPNNPTTWKALAGYFLRCGNFDAAITTADQGLKAVANDPALLAIQDRAHDLSALKDLKDSADLQPLTTILSIDPTNGSAMQVLAALSDSQSQHETPDQALARLAQVAEQNPKSLPAQMVLAERDLSAGRTQEAGETAARAMQAMPTEAEPARVLAAISASTGQWARELAAATEWRNRSPEQPLPADLEIARAKLHLNDPAGAIQQLAPYVDHTKTEPNPAVIRLYAQALVQSHRAADAQTLLDPLVKQSPRWRAIWLEIGTSTAKDAASAAQWIEYVIPLAPNDSAADQLALATAWYNTGQRFNDAACFAKARDRLLPLSQRSNASAQVWSMLGSAQQALNNLPDAQTAYRKALQLDPGLSMARNNLAYALLISGGDLNEAKTLAEQAVADSPRNSAFNDTLARIHAKTGDWDAALSGFQNAVRADPANAEALVGLADVQTRTGQRDQAGITLGQVDSLLRTHPPLSEPVRQELEQVRAILKKSPTTTVTAGN